MEPGPGGVTRGAAVALMAQRGIGYKAAARFYAELHELSDEELRQLSEKIKRWARWGRKHGHLQAIPSSTGRSSPRAVDKSVRKPSPAQEEEEEVVPAASTAPAPPPLVNVAELDRIGMARWSIGQWVWSVEDARFRGHSQAAQRALLQLQAARRELEAAEAERKESAPTFDDTMSAPAMTEALEELAGRLVISDLEVFVHEYLERTKATISGGDVWF